MLQAARRVYDTALSSLPSMQGSSSHQHSASLALAYAESELARGGNEAPTRALHVLAWLGTGGPFTPFKAPGKGTELIAIMSHMIHCILAGYSNALQMLITHNPHACQHRLGACSDSLCRCHDFWSLYVKTHCQLHLSVMLDHNFLLCLVVWMHLQCMSYIAAVFSQPSSSGTLTRSCCCALLVFLRPFMHCRRSSCIHLHGRRSFAS